jgi:hypothetical protein
MYLQGGLDWPLGKVRSPWTLIDSIDGYEIVAEHILACRLPCCGSNIVPGHTSARFKSEAVLWNQLATAQSVADRKLTAKTSNRRQMIGAPCSTGRQWASRSEYGVLDCCRLYRNTRHILQLQTALCNGKVATYGQAKAE